LLLRFSRGRIRPSVSGLEEVRDKAGGDERRKKTRKRKKDRKKGEM